MIPTRFSPLCKHLYRDPRIAALQHHGPMISTVQHSTTLPVSDVISAMKHIMIVRFSSHFTSLLFSPSLLASFSSLPSFRTRRSSAALHNHPTRDITNYPTPVLKSMSTSLANDLERPSEFILQTTGTSAKQYRYFLSVPQSHKIWCTYPLWTTSRLYPLLFLDRWVGG